MSSTDIVHLTSFKHSWEYENKGLGAQSLIIISKVKPTYHFFISTLLHLTCVQTWSRSQVTFMQSFNLKVLNHARVVKK